jgi:5'-methylthioadenosine phosphorylase
MSNLRIGLIGGTGLGEQLVGQEGAITGRRHEIDTPFGRPSDAIIEIQWGGATVLLLSRHGPGHLLNPSRIPNRANIFALKQLGCTHILASGAVGSLREEYKPRDLVIPDQLIDRTTRRETTFFESAAVHVEFAEPFCPVLRQIVLESAEVRGQRSEVRGQSAEVREQSAEVKEQSSVTSSSSDLRPLNSELSSVHGRGCYVAMEGPAFSTRAESLMHRLWGGDLIGMTACPEAKLSREAEIPYALIALVTDYDCWKLKPDPTDGAQGADAHELLKEIIGNVQAATASAVQLMKRTVELMSQRPEQLAACPANRALELAIWSDKTKIPAEEIDRLRPLWGKYFEAQT